MGKSFGADEFRARHAGELLKPPFKSARLAEIGELEETVLETEGFMWNKACADVVIGGLGWVALTGMGPIQLRVLAPQGVGVRLRDPLMPFEAKTSTESFAGASTHGTSRRTKNIKRRS